MKYILSFFVAIGILSNGLLQAQIKKFDSTLNMGKVAYRVTSNNKVSDRNEVIIKLYGFAKDARGMDFYLRGRVKDATIDDLNNDGYYDLLIFVYNGPNDEYGTVYAFISQENKALEPLSTQDPTLDGKINQGYKGHDEFSMVNGTVLRKFPIYKPGDENDKPTGGNRFVQYQAMPDERQGYKFQLLRSYDVK